MIARTQRELEEICAHGEVAEVYSGVFAACGSSQVTACDSSRVMACGSSRVTACGSSRVMAYDSSQVTAYGSSQVRAYGSSQVRAYDSSRVTACGSSQVTACDSSRVMAYDSSQVTAYGSSQVTAYGSSQVRAYGSSQVRASQYVAVTVLSKNARIHGGVRIDIPPLDTPQKWCEYHGVEISRGRVVLFKALNDDFSSPNGISYAPGTIPVAPDWDGGEKECGGGLHFSPLPVRALEFHPTAKRFCACPVALKDIVVHPDGDFPQKVKASKCCGPVWECDINGDPRRSD